MGDQFADVVQHIAGQVFGLTTAKDFKVGTSLGFDMKSMAEFQARFDALDKDNSNSLCLGEVTRAIESLTVREITDEQVEKVFAQLDSDNSGEISFSEFLALIK